MFLQDPVNRSINITAEIPNSVVAAFQKCCRQFTDILKKTTISFNFPVDFDKIRSSVMRTIDNTCKLADSSSKKPSDDQQYPLPPVSKEVFDLIEYEVSRLLHRSEHRIKSEKQIIDIVSTRIKSYDSCFVVHLFGSSTYGFGDSVDLNILVDTSGSFIITNSFLCCRIFTSW